MTKCDFCIKMSPDGKCWWGGSLGREGDCKKAIRLMMETIKARKSGKELK